MSCVEHGLDTEVVAVVAACVVLWGMVSARLERVDITAPIAFVALGLLVANGPVALIDIDAGSEVVRSIAEVALALVLFADASRVNLRSLRTDSAALARLFGIGLMLTIGLGAALAALVVGGVDLWVAAVIGAAIAPTDAALGASIVGDRRIPVRTRRVLNVESGLNDGIVTPFVNFFIAGALAGSAADIDTGVGGALADLGIGAAGGVAVGLVGGVALRVAWRRGWGARSFDSAAVLGLVLLGYAGAVELGANGFVAAFVAGLAFGSVAGEERGSVSFTEDAGGLMSLLVWFLFGAAMLVPAFEHVTWEDVAYAVLALTVVRMVPVAIALAGSGFDRSTVLFIGWFGPRGLATVVFGLIAFDELEGPDGRRVLAVVTVTVLLSVIAHGVSARPLGRRYARRSAGDARTGPGDVVPGRAIRGWGAASDPPT
jgi:NhaP-type Na+/H+ or K+/H+ antiporter